MEQSKRTTLSLGKLKTKDSGTDGDKVFEVGIYDVLLPCRTFSIFHKVAEAGRVSVTTEFFLRLIKCTDQIKEEDIAVFFGFSTREMAFVMTELVQNDFIIRENGIVRLTSSGDALFRDNAEHPEIVEVESRRENVGFDLLALAPEERRRLEVFESRLPELRPKDLESVGNATKLIPKAFRKHYSEIVGQKDRNNDATKKTLYSVDSVDARDRFASTIRLSLSSTSSRPDAVELELDDWRPDYERADRKATVDCLSHFTDGLKCIRRQSDQDAYNLLLELAPEFLKDFSRRNGLAVERYFREAISRAGEVRSDRPTVPIVGSLVTRKNAKRLFQTAEYGLSVSEGERPSSLLWLAPQVPFWGATSALPEMLDQLKQKVLSDREDDDSNLDVKSIALLSGIPMRHLEKAFDVIAVSDRPPFFPALEILLIPGVLVTVLVNAPIGSTNAIPVPLGFVSFDKLVINRALAFLRDRLGAYSMNEQIMKALVESKNKSEHSLDGESSS